MATFLGSKYVELTRATGSYRFHAVHYHKQIGTCSCSIPRLVSICRSGLRLSLFDSVAGTLETSSQVVRQPLATASSITRQNNSDRFWDHITLHDLDRGFART
ncbi:MAG: hypothetical protein ABI988_06705 [Nitrospirota bacterium]